MTSEHKSRARRLAPDPRHTAVVCVECQNGVLGPNSVLPGLAADSQAVLEGVEKLVKTARAAGVPVVHATFAGHLGAVDPGTAPLWRMLAKPTAHWTTAHPDTQVLSRLLEESDLVLPRHHGYSPTWGTELLPVLRAKGVRTIVFAGVSLNVAITLATADATNEGFEVMIARDAVGATPPEYGEQVLRNTLAMLAQIVTVGELAEGWRESALSRAAG